MTTITSLDLCTVPLTEEGVERYKISDSVSNHLTSLFNYTEDLNCSVGRIFNKVKVPVSWITVNAANYIKATMEFNNPSGSTLQIYGWIDSVDPISDTDDYAAVEVKWHFDYWEMYKSSMTFGYGHIKRRPFDDLDSTPIQNYQKRYEKIGTYSQPIIEMMEKRGMKVWWIILSVNTTSGGITSTRTYTYPVMVDGDQNSDQNAYFYVRDFDDSYNPKKVQGCLLRHIYYGQMDEFLARVLGVAPDAINGIWICPFCPYTDESNITGDGTFADPFVVATPYPVSKVGTQEGLIELATLAKPLDIHRDKSITKIKSSEENRYVLTSTDGVKILELPYGFEVDKIKTTLVIEPDGPYFEISFKDLSYGNLEGLTVNVPLLSFPMNSNSYASYVYSGRQEYDRNMRTVRSNADAWKSSAAGAGSGAMMGAFGPAGLIVGSVGGTVGGLVGYGVETGYQNDAEQQLENRLQASQPSTMILSSNGLLSFLRGYGFVIKDIVPDDYSSTQISNIRSNFGISVDEILSSCDTQIRTTAPTGYYRIENMIITGSVPKEAKDYVKKKFASGVKLL